MKGYFNDQALEAYEFLVAEAKGFDFSEGGSTYDFTRCVRPDGSAYGTGGKCRQGTESGPAPEQVKKAKDVIQEGIKGSSPARLKQLAKESGSNSVRGDLTVTPEGKYILKGKKVTLNDAIMYLGKLNKAESKASKPKTPGDDLYNSLFRGEATRKQRGAKPDVEPGKGRYLAAQQKKKDAKEEADRENERRIRTGQRGTWNAD